MAGVPAEAVEEVRRWADARTPPEHCERMAVEVSVRGRSITIWDCERPPGMDWLKSVIVQLRRCEQAANRWSVFWQYRERWLLYDDFAADTPLADALDLIDEDPDCVFWG